MNPLTITLNSESLAILLKSNISCYLNKPLTQELIDTLTEQIVDSIDYFINKKVDE